MIMELTVVCDNVGFAQTDGDPILRGIPGLQELVQLLIGDVFWRRNLTREFRGKGERERKVEEFRVSSVKVSLSVFDSTGNLWIMDDVGTGHSALPSEDLRKQ